jgi:hypothetical protein
MRSQLGDAADRTDITMQPYLCVTVYEYYVAFYHTKLGNFRGLDDAINPTKFSVEWFNRFGSTGDRISRSRIGSVNGPMAHWLVPPRCHIIHATAQAVLFNLLRGKVYIHAVRVV